MPILVFNPVANLMHHPLNTAKKYRHSKRAAKFQNNFPIDLTFTSNEVEDCFKFCGLLTKAELYC